MNPADGWSDGFNNNNKVSKAPWPAEARFAEQMVVTERRTHARHQSANRKPSESDRKNLLVTDKMRSILPR
jgi:hypothetical protein